VRRADRSEAAEAGSVDPGLPELRRSRTIAYGRNGALAEYAAFVVRNGRLLGFGFLLAFCSSFGQTFYIGLFSGEIRGAFGLTNSTFGGLYSAATLCSALLLPTAGGLIDRVALRPYSIAICAGLAVGALIMAGASGPAMLFGALLVLRLCGQGLMSHTALTTMVRAFRHGRGRALSIASLGFASGEAAFPAAAVAALAWADWRMVWVAGGAVLILCVIPSVWWILAGGHAAGGEIDAGAPAPTDRQWDRRAVRADPSFYLLLLVLLAPSFFITGFFFHQAAVAAEKGWSLKSVAAAFSVYALTKIAVSLGAGAGVDRFGALRCAILVTPTLALAYVVLGVGEAEVTVFAYMMLTAAAHGISVPVSSALWVEVYGVTHAGAIRSMVAAFGVFASALSPVAMGLLIDLHVGAGTIAFGSAAYCAAAAVLMWGLAERLRTR